jgi:hypothetical protein
MIVGILESKEDLERGLTYLAKHNAAKKAAKAQA